jgi:beta-glucanase (GH16 family)
MYIYAMKFLPFLILFSLILTVSCSKKNSSGTTDTAPTNLNVSAVVSTDSSGNVAFTSTATNAANFTYDFGNNVSQLGVQGNVTYKYPFSGSYTVTVTAYSAGGLSISKTIPVSVVVAFRLVWSDEFDTPGSPDPTKWGYDLGAGGWGNNELENYTNRQANALVSNGTLKIYALKESYNGSSYTSARMLTNNLYSFEYGRIDVRAKLPASTGTWPAIWMLGNDIATVSWPACGEIDIMEQSGSAKSTIYGTMHYPTEVGQYGDGSSTTNNTASTAFHLYSALWSPQSIQLSVDSVVYYTLSINQTTPFNQKFFIILNVAMGGNFGGAVSPAFTTDSMEVDYVHVYQ